MPTPSCPSGFVKVPYRNLTICVAPDYYQENGVRVPVDLREAHAIAEANNAVLPTPEMVDAIWTAADVKLSPRPLNPSNTGNPNFYNGGSGGIADPKWYALHDQIVDEQLRQANARPGALIAGHKKDIVQQPGNSSRIAIYGWHQSNGRPIQPRSTVHSWDYKDYSQGLRLVSKTAFDSDGNPVTLGY